MHNLQVASLEKALEEEKELRRQKDAQVAQLQAQVAHQRGEHMEEQGSTCGCLMGSSRTKSSDCNKKKNKRNDPGDKAHAVLQDHLHAIPAGELVLCVYICIHTCTLYI